MSRAPQARTIASPTARTPSEATTATTVGPEPESVAPYAPACRAALVTSSYPGTSARRNGTCSTSSSPAARSRGSACASPWTRAALFAAARTASAWGRVAGSAARALRLHGEVRDREHQRQRLVNGKRRHDQTVRSPQHEVGAAEHGRCHVVRVAFELAAELHH